MKTMDLNQYGLTELNTGEMEAVEGGFFPIPLVVAGVLLLSGCKLSKEAPVIIAGTNL